MTGRRCSTCKHYEPAPIWRKGWCRNPILYAPQQSHLVGEDELDCERGMGNYWEAADATLADQDVAAYGVVEQPLTLYIGPVQGREIYTSSSGQPVYSISGSSGYGSEPPAEPPASRGGSGGGGGSGGNPPPGRDRQFTYYPEQHSWLDYVRVAAPILGVILIVIFAWIWISTSFLDDDGESGDSSDAETTRTTLPVITASPSSTVQAGATGTPQIIQTAPPVATTGTTGEPGATEPPVTGGEIYAGAVVEVANTGGEGLRLRADTSTESEVLAEMPEGTQLTTTGESIETNGFVWWPVDYVDEAGTTFSGFVATDFLVLIE